MDTLATVLTRREHTEAQIPAQPVGIRVTKSVLSFYNATVSFSKTTPTSNDPVFRSSRGGYSILTAETLYENKV